MCDHKLGYKREAVYLGSVCLMLSTSKKHTYGRGKQVFIK